MARAPENENITRNAETNAENQANQSFGQYQTNLGTLEKGGQVAANPWKSAGYLSNVNRLQSGALNAETNAGENELQQTNHRTGGLNSGATIGATKDLALAKTRLGSQLTSERAANDFGKNVNYQTHMAEAPLAPYDAATNLVGETNKDLTGYGMQSQHYLYSLYDKAMQAAATAASAGDGAAG
ncbi:MAG: hypothetical protein WA741_15575 [Candidatus Sulfotelmatobacter sp.]